MSEVACTMIQGKNSESWTGGVFIEFGGKSSHSGCILKAKQTDSADELDVGLKKTRGW